MVQRTMEERHIVAEEILRSSFEVIVKAERIRVLENYIREKTAAMDSRKRRELKKLESFQKKLAAMPDGDKKATMVKKVESLVEAIKDC